MASLIHDMTGILQAIEEGDPHAAEHLLTLVYDELRRLAAPSWPGRSPGKRSSPPLWSTRPTFD
jgi:hypothetical protein